MVFGMEVGLSPDDFVLDADPAPAQNGAQPAICGPCLLWPKGWMDKYAMWYRGRPWPKLHCVTWRPSSPPPKKGAQPLIFGLCLSWLNGCMYQDTSWYRGRPHPRRHCVRCGPSSPPLKGHSPQFSANARCDQTAGCTKVPLGVEIALGPGDFVFNWDPALPQKKGTAHPIFGPCLLCPNGWMDEGATWYESRLGPGHIMLDGDPAPPRKGHSSSPSLRPMSIVARVAYLSYCLALVQTVAENRMPSSFRFMSIVAKRLDG